MAATVLLSYAVLLSAAFPSTIGQTSLCNQAVAVQNGRACECLTADQLYDYSKQDCVDQSTLYAFGDCGPNASGPDCVCDSGWNKDSDTGLCTEATATCPDETCGTDEECMDLPGRSYCRCEDYLYRFSDTECDTIMEIVNPQWHDCPQGYQDETKGYTCYCANPYFIDLGNEGKNCTINSDGGYEDCSTEAIVCAEEDGEEVVNFPRSGYDEAGDDIDECTTLTKTYCWSHSTCLNLEGGQGYLCECDSGYTDEFFDTPIKECVLKEEPHCAGCACNDLCGEDVKCSNGTVCSATSVCSADCAMNLEEIVLNSPTSVALYTGSVVVKLPQFDYQVNQISLSLETIIGKQDVQVLSKNDNTFMFQVTTQSGHMEGLNEGEVQGLIVGSCLSMEGSDLCQLPGGVITASDSIVVQALPSCTASSCPSSEYECEDLSNGRYQCNCIGDGSGEYFSNVLEICKDTSVSSTLPTTITTNSETTNPPPVTTPSQQQSTSPDYEQMAADLQKQLDDTEHSLTVTAATLGTLLAVSLIALGVLTFCYIKK